MSLGELMLAKELAQPLDKGGVVTHFGSDLAEKQDARRHPISSGAHPLFGQLDLSDRPQAAAHTGAYSLQGLPPW